MTVWKHRIMRPVSTVIAATLLAAGCGATHLDTGTRRRPPGHATGRGVPVASCSWRRDLPVVTLRLADSQPAPVVHARLNERVAVVSTYGRNDMRVPVPTRPGGACRFQTTTAPSGAVTAMYVMQAKGRVTFASGFRRPSAAMDPYLHGVVSVAGT